MCLNLYSYLILRVTDVSKFVFISYFKGYSCVLIFVFTSYFKGYSCVCKALLQLGLLNPEYHPAFDSNRQIPWVSQNFMCSLF